jgi:hypothetical protein
MFTTVPSGNFISGGSTTTPFRIFPVKLMLKNIAPLGQNPQSFFRREIQPLIHANFLSAELGAD